jgi:hypothetical protein
VFILRVQPFPYDSQLLGVGGYHLRGHNMPEAPYFFLKKLALLWLSCSWSLMESLQHFPEVDEVLLESGKSRSDHPGTRDMTLVRPLNMVSINPSNVAGTLQRPTGMIVNCHIP